jgi:hypothetical protein
MPHCDRAIISLLRCKVSDPCRWISALIVEPKDAILSPSPCGIVVLNPIDV